MITAPPSSAMGLLVSGGLDSCILVGHLLRQGQPIQPFYIDSGLIWQRAEMAAVSRFLASVDCPQLAPLVGLKLPLADLYEDHWCLTGQEVPDDGSPDEAVFLPGRNALLTIKAALWCQLHGIGQLAIAPLATSPFNDAKQEFFQHLESALNLLGLSQVELVQPFGRYTKLQVMRLGRDLPLDETFSCIDPVSLLHCGRCNKCAERREAFRSIARADPTVYASELSCLDFTADETAPEDTATCR